jgi:SAM-dependent methyltransferase
MSAEGRPRADVCVICGAGTLAPHFRRQGREFLICRACGCVLLAEAGGCRYDQDYFDSLRSNPKRCRESNAREQARLLDRFSRGRPGRLLDVGCGLGEFLAQAARGGWEAWGCDLPREDGAPPGGRIRLGAPEDWRFEASAFDAVTAFGVLEHSADPAALLARMTDWLRPGGLLLLVTPSLSTCSARVLGRYWPHFHGEHAAYFTEPALRSLVERHGFGELERFSWRKRVTPDFLLNQAERYFPGGVTGAAAGALRRLPEGARTLALLLPSGSVGLAARKL